MLGRKNIIKMKFLNNVKVIENYFFMTLLQIISSLFGILIYPFLIRILGPQSYGLYVFSISVTSYFVGFVSFGFSFPALKAIVENKDDIRAKNLIISSVFTAKCYLAILTLIIFSLLLVIVPFMRANWLIFAISFTQILSEILFPFWYFQGMQKMRIVTMIQLGYRIFSLPFIFIFIKTSSDIWIYALITSLSVIFSGLTSIIYLNIKEQITLHFVSIRKLGDYFRDALPFFWSSAASTIKLESATILIGSFFGMGDVALYDLANKIVTIPRMLTLSINSALFPKVIENTDKNIIRKIIRYEVIIGLSVVAIITIFGYWIVLLMGGMNMVDAYPLAIILSITVVTWLVIGSYINFIFVPQNHYYLVTHNQLIALITFFGFCIPGLLIFNNIFVMVAAISLSGLSEILYCNYLIKKHHML